MGELGATSPMIPVDAEGALAGSEKKPSLSEKDLHFNVFVHQKWTPYLMMLTLYNTIAAERIRRRGDLPAERQGGD